MYKNDKKSHLAKTLRYLRVNAGFTQQNMANVLRINRSTYTYYEMGKTTPDIQSLKILADVLKVDIDVFLEEGSTKVLLEDYEKRRPAKKVKRNPDRIGELSSKEKELIARLRMKDPEKLEEMLQVLDDRKVPKNQDKA